MAVKRFASTMYDTNNGCTGTYETSIIIPEVRVFQIRYESKCTVSNFDVTASSRGWQTRGSSK